MDATEVTAKCLEILRARCDSTSDAIRKEAQVMIALADALDGKSRMESIAILESVRNLTMVEHQK